MTLASINPIRSFRAAYGLFIVMPLFCFASLVVSSWLTMHLAPIFSAREAHFFHWPDFVVSSPHAAGCWIANLALVSTVAPVMPKLERCPDPRDCHRTLSGAPVVVYVWSPSIK
jgi:hypothetical protein